MNCEARYRFEERLAGRAMACRQCGAVFRVPPVPVHLQAPELPALIEQRWHLKLASGREFGPVLQDVVAEWVKEGRADADSLVCRDGTADWYRLPDIFPQFLTAAPAPGLPDEFAPAASIAEYLPAAGLLEHIKDEWNDMNAFARDAQQQALEGIEREVRRSMGAVKMTAVRHLITEEAKEFGGESPRDAVQMRPDHLLLCEFTAHSTCFCVIIPWGRMGRMAHEIFSILPGTLPHSLALRRAREDHYAGGMWIGINGRDDDILALSAARSQEQLASGIIWNWYSEKRDYTMVQVWGVQAVPLGAEKFLHAVQTNGRGPGGHELGLLWYLEKQSAFYRFARRLNVPDTRETHILFASNAAQILCRAADAIMATAQSPAG